MLAEIIAQRITRSAIDILKIVGVLDDRPEPPEDLDPEDAKVISMAEALLRRNRH